MFYAGNLYSSILAGRNCSCSRSNGQIFKHSLFNKVVILALYVSMSKLLKLVREMEFPEKFNKIMINMIFIAWFLSIFLGKCENN
jgi:hypothetical protein